ncbi:MAG: MFS transporter [Halothiobacillus sp. 14-56-357]|jgi:FSR family fosmidomycin resistance protein-like MFS transporter|uniref:MFS transporter n=1 Tax=Halothiobacillus sp. 15-55-196 TaxID=1970382 RepID=UPI000BCB9DCC|nr:MFS transporter [Halothiobacillus sp. 15-55-196]OZB36705.1 MAG: MFS transporter [Halothiobacillus sp. 15-55-196]OZB57387.1 MAG: MFS transporter [Halothiobacillus sp. 14-56-357]OZB79486.1 MAG: MFS transporter [Halothiobacillus sp. 13-55-115]
MSTTLTDTPQPAAPAAPVQTQYRVLGAISVSHFLNDLMQSLMISIYPLFKSNFDLSFAQIGLITLCFQLTASILQPLIGQAIDRRPMPYSLVLGMGFTLSGLITLAFAPSYGFLLAGAAMVGIGSSIFHPESSRVARMASGRRPGLAQSIFQVGGNGGSAAGPLLAALIVIPHGQVSISWFSAAALLAMVVLFFVGRWATVQHRKPKTACHLPPVDLSRSLRLWILVGLLTLMFSKFLYLASMNNYLTFYLMHRFDLPVQSAQLHLFILLFAVAAGTMLGGPIGDRIGRQRVIWLSILGVAPFTMLLPHMGLEAQSILLLVIGFVLASAFPAMVVYAQELFPNRIGAVSGLFFGFAFGTAGIGAALLGQFADHFGIDTLIFYCSFLPLIGVIALLLPDLREAPASSPT